MFDAKEIGKDLAEAAENAAKSLQEFAELLRETDKEAAEQSKYWKFHLEHEHEIAQYFADMTSEEYMKTLLSIPLVDGSEGRAMSDKEREAYDAFEELRKRYGKEV